MTYKLSFDPAQLPPRSEWKRTTVLLNAPSREHIGILSVMKGCGKNDVILDALTRYIKEAGFDPFKKPKNIIVEYE
ncbi:MAG: hypothetical protein NT120_00785 [Candidatus Aenigmarchaeota archaeon]|nr:hypothetical protein [Candidatus Aenigmarchaeota archaeon]